MQDHYLASHLALGAARLEMHSARPDAPVVPSRPRRSPGLTRTLRAQAAATLHRVAAALEPAPRPDRRLAARVEPSTACR